MNSFLGGLSGGEAEIDYHDSDIDIRKPGAFVTCAITGDKIGLQNLRYWSVDRQEAYRDAAASLEAHQKYLGQK